MKTDTMGKSWKHLLAVGLVAASFTIPITSSAYTLEATTWKQGKVSTHQGNSDTGRPGQMHSTKKHEKTSK